jgi:hypothetical protein
MEILFKGSQSEPYLIEIANHNDGQLEMRCNCQAGINGTHCKHRISVLTRSYSNVIYTDTTKNDLELLESWIPNTKLESAHSYMVECQKKADEWKKELTNAKRKLARIMEGK